MDKSSAIHLILTEAYILISLLVRVRLPLLVPGPRVDPVEVERERVLLVQTNLDPLGTTV